MKLEILSTKADLDRAAAELVAETVAKKPDAVLGLPTGDTPKGMYRLLGNLCRGGLDFARVTVFNLDQYAGIDPESPLSYAVYMRRFFYDRVNVPEKRRHIFNSAAADLERECAEYDRAIALAGGFDLAVLGVGRNGHIAFNEPGDGLSVPCHPAELSPTTIEANRAAARRDAGAELGASGLEGFPARAMTVGLGAIFGARELLVLVSGASKQGVLAGILRGEISTRLPASLLQLHPHCTLLADRQAAKGLRGR